MKGVGAKILRIGLSKVVLAYFITGKHDTTITHIYILSRFSYLDREYETLPTANHNTNDE